MHLIHEAPIPCFFEQNACQMLQWLLAVQLSHQDLMYQQASRRACYSPPAKNFPPCLHREQDPAHAWVASPNALMHHLWKCMEMIPHHYCLGPWVAFSMPTSALPAAHAEVNTEYQVQLMCWWPAIENVCCFGGVELPCFNDIESSWIIYGQHHPQKNKLAVDFQPHGVQSVDSKFQSCYTGISHFHKDLTGCVKEQWKYWCCRISDTFRPKPSKCLVCFAGFDHN